MIPPDNRSRAGDGAVFPLMTHEDHLDRPALERLQTERLDVLLDALLPANRFYAEKFRCAGLTRDDVRTPADLRRLPCTTKAELVADQEAHPPYGSNLTFPLESYTRLHQTSGTKGNPLRWLDVPAGWAWMLESWRKIFRIVGITSGDRLFFPFSFGPFLGFWTAFEAGCREGCLCLPGGGLSSPARLRMLLDHQATVLFCTPTYALHLAEVAREHGIPLDRSTPGYRLEKIVVAGEPGGSIPATRRRIEEAWGVRLFDHSGMTETGPMTTETPEEPGNLLVLEGDFIADIVDPATLEPVPPGALGELVVTNLGRIGSPLLRYRTGDLVRAATTPQPAGRTFLRLDGGVLGRTDDMIPIRGNNFYPGALENVLRRFPDVVEYRVTVDTTAALAELHVEVEPAPDAPGDLHRRLARTIRDELLFRADVVLVPPGSLPRFEMKASRIMRK